MNYQLYIVGQGDTLDEIAISQLGITDISGIVTANNLRHPYISDDPKDQYAHAKGQLTIQGTASAGSDSFTFQNPNGLQVRALDTVYFEDWTTGEYEGAVAGSVRPNSDGTVTINFQSPIQNTYTPSVVITLFSNQENVTTQVLQTGDTLYLPLSSTSATFTANNNGNTYGTDVAVGDNGVIQRTSNGWATVTGTDNVQQAVSMRWSTPYGAHPFHETYGNRMFDLIGETEQPYYWMLAETFATQCALSDPRVDALTNIQLSTQEDKTFISADITPSNSDSSFTVSTLAGGE